MYQLSHSLTRTSTSAGRFKNSDILLRAMASAGRIVIDISSSDDEEDETVSEEEDKKTVFCSVTNPKYFSVLEVLTKEEKETEDDECCILAFDPFDSLTADLNRSFNLGNHHKFEPGEEEELAILAERGKVACKDYPHSRYHCAEYPFHKTPHESFCAQCYCYVCDEPAPCVLWKANSSGHCHASDKEENWKNLRHSTRISQQNRKQNFSTKSNTIDSLPTGRSILMRS